MQRIFSGAIFVIMASCLTRLWVACEADQQVTAPSTTSAMAQDGPIEPCVWIVKS